MGLDDRDIEQAFDRRYATIEPEIPPAPAFSAAVRGSQPRRRTAWLALGAILAATVVVLAGIPLLGLSSIVRPMASGSPDLGQHEPTSFPTPDAVFPTRIGDLSVISVAEALERLDAGDLDGRAVAVAGYYDAIFPGCPVSLRYTGELESGCRMVAFADAPEDARVCGVPGGGCREPTSPHLSPFILQETTPDAGSVPWGDNAADPLPLVLIGHAGDARQWACSATGQAACGRAFVVDRIAWSREGEIPVRAVVATDEHDLPLTPSNALAGIEASAEITGELVTAAVVKARDVATIDPRWSLAGDNLVWLVRTLGDPVARSLGSDRARPEMEWLVDDATGQLIDSQLLELDPGYRPARVWELATVHGPDAGADDIWAFARVETPAGIVSEGRFGGAAVQPGEARFGGSPPLILPAGEYSISVWLASYLTGVGAPQHECSTTMTFAPEAFTAFMADFSPGQPCTIARADAPVGGP